MQVITPSKVYPVIVIGSGASGGMAAWNLTRQGIEVVLLDAGDKFDRIEILDARAAMGDAGAAARGEKPETFFLDTQEQPYLTPNERPFDAHARLGTRRQDQRLGTREPPVRRRSTSRRPSATAGRSPGRFPTRTSSPYYDKVEQLIGVNGGTDDSDAARQQVPSAAAGAALRRTAAAEEPSGSSDIPIVAGRRANMTRPTRGFPACHYCGNCGNGCDTASFFCSADHLLPFALETGKLETAIERRGGPDPTVENGLAKGVQYFDRKTGAEQQVLGKVVVVGASCMDSTRLLLNSISERYPNGIGNGSDVIGRYLCEQIRLNARGFLPAL